MIPRVRRPTLPSSGANLAAGDLRGPGSPVTDGSSSRLRVSMSLELSRRPSAGLPTPPPDLVGPQPSTPVRTLQDPEGPRWMVYEWLASAQSAYPGRRFLVFDAVTVLRRL